MNTIRVCDSTIRKLSNGKDNSLSFKEKLEVAKLLDKLCVDVIELDEIRSGKADSLLIKSVVTAVRNSIIAVPVALGTDPAPTAKALAEAKRFRLQVVAPGSSVRMEYVYHKKSAAIVEMVKSTVEECRKYTEDVELLIDDATRGDMAVISEMVNAAIEKGATTVTFCDDAGTMLPEEFATFLEERPSQSPTGGIRRISGRCCAAARGAGSSRNTPRRCAQGWWQIPLWHWLRPSPRWRRAASWPGYRLPGDTGPPPRP